MLDIASTLDLPDVEKIAKSHNPPFLDIGRQAKLKGAVESPMAPLTTLAGICLERYAIFDSIKNNPWLVRLGYKMALDKNMTRTTD